MWANTLLDLHKRLSNKVKKTDPRGLFFGIKDFIITNLRLATLLPDWGVTLLFSPFYTSQIIEISTVVNANKTLAVTFFFPPKEPISKFFFKKRETSQQIKIQYFKFTELGPR